MIPMNLDWFVRSVSESGFKITTLRISEQFVRETGMDRVHFSMALAEVGLRPGLWLEADTGLWWNLGWDRLLTDDECRSVVKAIELSITVPAS